MKKTFTIILLFLTLLLLFVSIIQFDKPVEFADQNLESAVRGILEHSGKPIYQSLLLNIFELDLSDQEIQNLSGIENFRNLEVLNLNNNQITDVSQLNALTNLRILNLGNNNLSDLKIANFNALSNLHIISLVLDNNYAYDNEGKIHYLSDIDLLSQFQELENLSLNDNRIQDFSILKALESLSSISISRNNISDIGFFSEISQLEKINLKENNIVDLSPLSALGKLIYLNLHSNSNIYSIQPLHTLSNLETLILRNVPVGEEIYVLENMQNLSRLNIRNCGIQDISTIAGLMNNGALQDNQNLNTLAYIDILDNPVLSNSDNLSQLIPYWDNLNLKYPWLLNFTTLTSLAFSHEGGFFAEPFELIIQSNIKNALIFYTLDGSIPTPAKNEYKAPILIPGLIPDDGSNQSGVIVRARQYSAGIREVSPVTTQSYFFVDNKNPTSTLPVVSMAIDPAFLFHEEIGIYAYGNFQQRGTKWERPAHISFYEVDGTFGFSKSVNVRIHGNASRKLRQKSFRVYANVDYEDEKFIFYEIFPGYTSKLTGEPLQSFNTLLLRNSGNDHQRTMFRDGFVQSLTDQNSMDVQGYRPAVLYINGEYWGIYNIRERIDEYYIENHYGIDIDQVDILEYAAHIGLVTKQGDSIEYLNLYQFIHDNDVSKNETYNDLKKMIDLDNLIDYYIIQIYSANLDWPQNNNVFWRARIESNENKFEDNLTGERWRWILYDLDFSFHNYSLNLVEHATRETESTFLFRSLLENEQFKLQFINRFADHLNSTFNPHHVIDKINYLQLLIEPEIKNHIDRWEMPSTMEVWFDNISNMNEFAQKRPEIVVDHLNKKFDLGIVYEISTNSDPLHGHIIINSLDLKSDTLGVNNAGMWKGNYFSKIPIRLHAEPQPGFRFVRWESSIFLDKNEQALIIQSDKDFDIKAIFEPDLE